MKPGGYIMVPKPHNCKPLHLEFFKSFGLFSSKEKLEHLWVCKFGKEKHLWVHKFRSRKTDFNHHGRRSCVHSPKLPHLLRKFHSNEGPLALWDVNTEDVDLDGSQMLDG